MTTPFYYRTHVFAPTPLPIQAVNAISIFRNDRKVFAVERVSADCRLPTGHIYFYLVIAGQYN